ncbi:MAG: hypothetical protein HWD61_01770 [Parachlamydiaceae bacterium]|nr:MAG: hypothetical protein HWD61_01770 [Parachlamydiaceae bacterium]
MYPLLAFAANLGGGVFGLGAFLLMAILHPLFSVISTQAHIWFEGLFPEQNLSLFDQIMLRIQSRWDDYTKSHEASSFENLFKYGTISDKQKVLDTIAEGFNISYSPILQSALNDNQNVVRIQAAAILTKIDTEFDNKLKKLEKLHQDSPDDLVILLQLAEHTDLYATIGITDEVRSLEIASSAVFYYRKFLEVNKDQFVVWLAVARLLLFQNDYESFIEWYEKGKDQFKYLPSILNSWYLQALYKRKQINEMFWN